MLLYRTRPFLKWVGGKSRIVEKLLQRIPGNYGTYHEPFLGSGALFLRLGAAGARLSDGSGPLISAWQHVRDFPEYVIGRLWDHSGAHSPQYYLAMRRKFLQLEDGVEKATLMIYLNRTCFNGVFRVNGAGEFNVGLGRGSPKFDEENLRRVSALLRNVTLQCHDFSQNRGEEGDFYYLDPPYDGGFTSYCSGGFCSDDQRRLSLFCRELHRKKIRFMLSNADTPFIRNLYEGFTQETIAAPRSVSCKTTGRKETNELLIRNYGEP